MTEKAAEEQLRAWGADDLDVVSSNETTWHMALWLSPRGVVPRAALNLFSINGFVGCVECVERCGGKAALDIHLSNRRESRTCPDACAFCQSENGNGMADKGAVKPFDLMSDAELREAISGNIVWDPDGCQPGAFKAGEVMGW